MIESYWESYLIFENVITSVYYSTENVQASTKWAHGAPPQFLDCL